MLTTSGISNAGGQLQEHTDTRTTLERFRRHGLYYILRANGHDIDENMTGEKMLNYARAYEDELDLSKVNIMEDGHGGFIVEKPQEITQHERVVDEDVQEKRAEFKDMSWSELKTAAKEAGINSFGKKKDDLIAELAG